MHAIHKREKNQKNIQSEPFCIEAFELELEGGGKVGKALVASKQREALKPKRRRRTQWAAPFEP